MSILSETPCVLDVGANVGQYAERLRDEGYLGKIISFEPGHEAFAILQRKARSAGQWEARRTALGKKTGSATLHVSANSVSSSLLAVGEQHLAAAPRSLAVSDEPVPVTTLDDQAQDLDGPFFLKIDVQGYELPVLEGALKTLKRSLAVQVEVSFSELYHGETRWTTLIEWLQARHFEVRYLEPGYEDPATGYMLQCDLLLTRDDTASRRSSTR